VVLESFNVKISKKMRILKSIFYFTIVIGLIGLVIFLVFRELLLISAVSQVRNSITQLRQTASNTGVYAQQCRELGVSDQETTAISSLQLRFDSPTSYVLEVVCNEFALNPIQIEQKELPLFTQKTPGSSGLAWGDEVSGIGLEVLGRTRGIFMQGNEVWYDNVDKTVGLPGPLTTCQGHGYTCCQQETSIGSGLTLTEVTDCPQNCHSKCELRPLVLSLTTQPFFDQTTRQLTVTAGQPIEVGFVIDPQGSKDLRVELDFGDGTKDAFNQFQGRASHVYNCSKAVCNYQISVIATNDLKIDSALTAISKVKVVVTP
jgi:hypothetical protein